MIVAHIMGIPVEETLGQLVPIGATIVTVVAVVGRAKLGVRFRRGGRAARD
jgi:hypothetical protein